MLTIATGSLEGVPLIHEAEGLSAPLVVSPQVLRPPQCSGRVLVAEDNPDNQRLISMLIHRAGGEVTVASNGQEAVEQAQEQDYDLVLMDMQMPGMGGLEATELLRLTCFDRPIVALTANATETDRTQAREVGCDDFLSKPIDQSAFFFSTLARYLPEGAAKPTARAVAAPLGRDDDPEFTQLRKGFLRGLPQRLAEIDSACETQAWDRVRSLAHQLKGVAATFGLPEATRIAGAIEFQIMRGDYVEVGALTRELHEVCA